MMKPSKIPASMANIKNVITTLLFTRFFKSLNIFSGDSITGNCNKKNTRNSIKKKTIRLKFSP